MAGGVVSAGDREEDPSSWGKLHRTVEGRMIQCATSRFKPRLPRMRDSWIAISCALLRVGLDGA